MNESVQDGVGEGGVRDPSVPSRHGDLGNDHGSLATVAVVEDFEQVSGLGGGQGVSEPVIQDEQMGASQLRQ